RGAARPGAAGALPGATAGHRRRFDQLRAPARHRWGVAGTGAATRAPGDGPPGVLLLTPSERRDASMSSDETGLNLFEDNASAAGGFPRATVGGYQRQPVDDYLRHLEGQLTETRQRCRALEAELGRLERELASRPPLREDLDFSDLGGHTSQILALARAQAREIIAEADATAAERADAAAQQAATVRAEAEQEAADVRAASLDEARAMRAQLSDDSTSELGRARAEAAAIVAAAEREAETVRLRARAAADDVTEQARLAAERTVAAAEHAAGRTRAASAEEREVALAEMDRARAEHERRTSEMFQQASEHAR